MTLKAVVSWPGRAWPTAMLLSAAALAVPSIALGAKVFRCQQDGHTTYSQTPCPAGREVDAADTRTDAQRREAEQAARRDQREARDLARERRQRERAAAGQTAIGIGPTSAASAPASSPAGRTKDKSRPLKPKEALVLQAPGAAAPAGAKP